MTNKPLSIRQAYSEAFMGQAAAVTGSGVHGYLTQKLPLAVDDRNAAKIWAVSNSVCFTWNLFTEHQNNVDWADGYCEIKKLLPPFNQGDRGDLYPVRI